VTFDAEVDTHPRRALFGGASFAARRCSYPVAVPEELEPLLEWFGHGVVDGVVVDGVLVDGVVVVEAAPDTTVPRPRPRPTVLPAMPMPNRNFLRDDVTLLCSLALIRPPDRGGLWAIRWRADRPKDT
jgi:hypothetical protein